MKTAKDILQALQVSKPTKEQKEHAKTLGEIYAMIGELLPAVSEVQIKGQKFFFGRRYDQKNYKSEPWIVCDGLEMIGEKWTIKTASGSYSVSLPVGNAFYNAFCKLLSAHVPQPDQVKTVEPDRTLIFEKELTSEVKKAMKFIKYDNLGAQKNNVHVTVKNGRCEIMGTDGSKLYRSGFLYLDEQAKDITFLLPIGALQVAKIKDSLTIGLYFERHKITGRTKITKGVINGISFEHCENEPLNYDQVIPTYYDFVQFDKKELIQVIKSVLPCANKITHQIRIHFNGAIFVSAEDLDFSSENNVTIQYSKKTVKDFEIGFNGKLLLDCLNSIDGNLIRLYSNGDPSKAVVIDNKALLMPVMLNQYA